MPNMDKFPDNAARPASRTRQLLKDVDMVCEWHGISRDELVKIITTARQVNQKERAGGKIVRLPSTQGRR